MATDGPERRSINKYTMQEAGGQSAGVNEVTPVGHRPVPGVAEDVLQRAIDAYLSYPREAHIRFGCFLNGEPASTFDLLKQRFETDPLGFRMSDSAFLGGLLVGDYEVSDYPVEGWWSKFRSERCA